MVYFIFQYCSYLGCCFVWCFQKLTHSWSLSSVSVVNQTAQLNKVVFAAQQLQRDVQRFCSSTCGSNLEKCALFSRSLQIASVLITHDFASTSLAGLLTCQVRKCFGVTDEDVSCWVKVLNPFFFMWYQTGTVYSPACTLFTVVTFHRLIVDVNRTDT